MMMMVIRTHEMNIIRYDDNENDDDSDMMMVLMMIVMIVMIMVVIMMVLMMVSDTLVCSIQAHRPYRFEQRSLSVRSCSVCMWWSMA